MVELSINPIKLYKKSALRKKIDLNRKNYIQLSGELFKRVQLNKIFPDSKTFTDSIPLKNVSTILKEYEIEKNHKEFDLKNFILNNFQIPTLSNDLLSNAMPPSRSIENYINSLWSVLYRNSDTNQPNGSTLIPLPNPYIVPGGRFREIYYWDSYFTALGLVKSKMTDMVKNMCDNFSYLIDKVGFIPNSNRVYHTTRSQPPVFVQMVELLAEHTDQSVIQTYLPYIEKEYSFWMKNRTVNLPDGVLNRYYDADNIPREEAYLEERLHAHSTDQNKRKEYYLHNRAAAESGWDFSGRWFDDHKSLSRCVASDIIPVDLNCLLYIYEKKLHEWFKSAGEKRKSNYYLKQSTNRVLLIQKYLYDKDEKFFCDYNLSSNSYINYPTLACMFALYARIATKEQAHHCAKYIKEKFLYPGGLVTSLQETGEQWDFPNGWAPLQWISIQGLKKYGYNDLASEIKARWLKTCEKTFNQTGELYEKYNVVNPNKYPKDGEYPVQFGFGWTNGVYIALLHDK